MTSAQRKQLVESKESSMKTAQHHHQLSGAVRRIHWLLFERNKVGRVFSYLTNQLDNQHNLTRESHLFPQTTNELKAKDAYIARLEQKLLKFSKSVSATRTAQMQRATMNVRSEHFQSQQAHLESCLQARFLFLLAN